MAKLFEKKNLFLTYAQYNWHEELPEKRSLMSDIIKCV
jgi:hypothetical protein